MLDTARWSSEGVTNVVKLAVLGASPSLFSCNLFCFEFKRQEPSCGTGDWVVVLLSE